MSKIANEGLTVNLTPRNPDGKHSGNEGWQRWALAWEQTASRTWFQPALDARAASSEHPASAPNAQAAPTWSQPSQRLAGRVVSGTSHQEKRVELQQRSQVGGMHAIAGGRGSFSSTQRSDWASAGKQDQVMPSQPPAAESQNDWHGSTRENTDTRAPVKGASSEQATPHQQPLQDVAKAVPEAELAHDWLEVRIATSRIMPPETGVAPSSSAPAVQLQTSTIRTEGAAPLPRFIQLGGFASRSSLTNDENLESGASRSAPTKHARSGLLPSQDKPVRLTLTPHADGSGVAAWVGLDRGMERLAQRHVELIHQHLAGVGVALVSVQVNGQAWAAWRADMASKGRDGKPDQSTNPPKFSLSAPGSDVGSPDDAPSGHKQTPSFIPRRPS